MKSLKEALALTDPEEVYQEIKQRRALREGMVGTLYPKIMAEEEDQLTAYLAQLRREKEKAI